MFFPWWPSSSLVWCMRALASARSLYFFMARTASSRDSYAPTRNVRSLPWVWEWMLAVRQCASKRFCVLVYTMLRMLPRITHLHQTRAPLKLVDSVLKRKQARRHVVLHSVEVVEQPGSDAELRSSAAHVQQADREKKVSMQHQTLHHFSVESLSKSSLVLNVRDASSAFWLCKSLSNASCICASSAALLAPSSIIISIATSGSMNARPWYA